ncbi:MAG: hypothetical protein SVJ22_11645, partial [Halobacteriota archaeon]|nr:hypothetical protein [Halobacteriota archaeon]
MKYAQVCKKRERGRVVEVVQRVVFGNPEEILRLLCADSGGKINTSYIERLNLTIRNSLASNLLKSLTKLRGIAESYTTKGVSEHPFLIKL